MKLLSREARNRAAAATSSGRPARPSGTPAVARSRTAAGAWARAGVSIGPGLRVLTRIERPASSSARLRASERTAALVAAYTPYRVDAEEPAAEPSRITEAPSRNRGRA